MDIKVIVASHKKYEMPKDRNMYVPVYAGRAVTKSHVVGWERDNTGENISHKNKNYCELTAIYWAWKNVKADYIGLVHYRRHFYGAISHDEISSVLSQTQAERLLKRRPVILPKPRNYLIETTYEQYIHAHNKQDIDVTLEVLDEFYPRYLAEWFNVMQSKKGHRFNMFIMRKDIFDAYCSWLFDVLSKVEERLDISEYSENDQRVFGFLAERLLDVWLETNKIRYNEVPVIHLEGEQYIKKGIALVKRKFIGKR